MLLNGIAMYSYKFHRLEAGNGAVFFSKMGIMLKEERHQRQQPRWHQRSPWREHRCQEWER